MTLRNAQYIRGGPGVLTQHDAVRPVCISFGPSTTLNTLYDHRKNVFCIMMLPTELCELVIDEVDDKITLHATSLVCKAWLARSRYNLFRVVELLLEAHLDRRRPTPPTSLR